MGTTNSQQWENGVPLLHANDVILILQIRKTMNLSAIKINLFPCCEFHEDGEVALQ